MEAIKKRFEENGQGHVFAFWTQLNDTEKKQLLEQLTHVDPVRINAIFAQATASAPTSTSVMEPLPASCFDSTESASPATVQQWHDAGMAAIGAGAVAVVLLAGGQGTRLGSAAPKGCYDIGLPSHKSLFQLQAERILRLMTLSGKQIAWYVMTSGPTRADTEAFFRKHAFFGMPPHCVTFFEQGVLPALTNDGKIILEDRAKLSMAPDGNGGVYAALRTSGVLDDMHKRGIKYIHAYCVDNCLVRVADPVFLGYCILKGAQCGAEVVRKAYAHESVGVVCRVNGKYAVVEYSEISKQNAEKRTADGRLALDAANIANHFYTLDFLHNVCSVQFEQKLHFHVANKKIKSIDLQTGEVSTPQKPNGIKLELFIFDIFPFLPSPTAGASQDGKSAFAVLSMPRSDVFSPLKNAPGAGVDCPESSRYDLFTQSIAMLKHAGATAIEPHPSSTANPAEAPVETLKLKQYRVDEASGTAKEHEVERQVLRLEVSPLVSYAGEGLSEVVQGKKVVLHAATYIASMDDLKKLVV